MPALLERTMTDAFDEVAEGRAGAALRFEGGGRSFAEVAETYKAFADGLATLGHGKGEPGAVWLPNRPEWFVSYLGFAEVGAPVVTVNTRYRTHELAYMLEDSGMTTLVLQGSLLTRDYLSMLREVCPAVDDVDPADLGDATDLALERVVVLEPDGEASVPAGAYTYEEVVARGREAPAPASSVAVEPDDPATVFYTSGTTSRPKGVVHDHVSTVNHPLAMADWLGVTPEDTALAVVPVCGVAGFDFAWSALLSGATLVCHPSFEPEAAAEAIEREPVTYTVAVGEMYADMLETDYDLTAVERGTAWLADQDDLAAIESRFSFPVLQPYGLSEGHSHMCVGRPRDPAAERHAAGGPPIHDDIEIQVRDPETGEVLESGDPGELHLRGYVRMVEYLNKPERTAEDVDDDGWLATGDMCEIDGEGRLLYHSRIEDMLRLRGFRVAPQEVERAIEDHWAVDRAQVVGVPRGDGEEVAVAFVRLAGDRSVSGEDVAAFMNERVADYKVPSRFEFVETFPTTESPNGEKIQRTELVERAGELVETDRKA